LGASVAGVAAAVWDVMPVPSATHAIRRDATARRKPAEKRCRRMSLTCFFSCKTVTSVPIVITKNAFTPILTWVTAIRYGMDSDLSREYLRSVRTWTSVAHAAPTHPECRSCDILPPHDRGGKGMITIHLRPRTLFSFALVVLTAFIIWTMLFDVLVLFSV